MRNLSFDEDPDRPPVHLSRSPEPAGNIEALAFAAGTIEIFRARWQRARWRRVGAGGQRGVTPINHLVNRQFPDAGSVLIGQASPSAANWKTGDTVVATLTPLPRMLRAVR
ncbi:MAG: hypothetical protein IPO61_17920 [Gammaproteobacteria bacterium]|nr:hypothetical protein [Gammaproteobacteria bacterium]